MDRVMTSSLASSLLRLFRNASSRCRSRNRTSSAVVAATVSARSPPSSLSTGRARESRRVSQELCALVEIVFVLPSATTWLSLDHEFLPLL
jgi:hypothetical protein